MSIDPSFLVNLPDLDFSATDLGPAVPADIPAAVDTVEAAYAEMLPAGHGGLDVGSPRLLVTVHVDDTEEVLLQLLAELAEPQALRSMWPLRTFTVEASVSASLAGVGAIAIVVKPIFDPPGTRLDQESLRGLIADLATQLRSRLAPGGDGGETEAVPGPRPNDPAVAVQPIERGDEYALYAGRHFREMRFGIDRRDPMWAATCARLIASFSAALGRRGVPLAYLHFPLLWDSLPPSWHEVNATHVRWLRMAYAVPSGGGDTSVDTGIELDAWGIADDEGVGLAAYEPTIRGALEDRFVLLTPPPPFSAVTTPDASTINGAASQEAHGPANVALGVEVLAKAGLLADVMRDLPAARVYGCTVAVLYGQTLCNIVVDEATSEELVRRVLQKDGGVAPHPVQPTVQVVRRSNDQDFVFWVAWCCGDRPGVMRSVLQTVRSAFQREDQRMPNINYAISRVLADGRTCAGKVELICLRQEAARMGLLDPNHPVGERANESLGGWRRLETALGRAIAPALVGWAPQTVEWLARPVTVGDAEPSEQPWAQLIVPEGAVEEAAPVAPDQRYWAEDIFTAMPRSHRRPLNLSTFIGAVDRLVLRWAPSRDEPGNVAPLPPH